MSALIEVAVNSTGQIAFQESTNLSLSLAFGASFFDVSLGFGITDCSMHGDEGSFKLAVTASVESVSHGLTR